MRRRYLWAGDHDAVAEAEMQDGLTVMDQRVHHLTSPDTPHPGYRHGIGQDTDTALVRIQTRHLSECINTQQMTTHSLGMKQVKSKL